MAYVDLDNRMTGIRDCPKCKFSMVPLKQHNSIRVNEGYSIDDGNNSFPLVGFLFGWVGVVGKILYRNVLGPLLAKTAGEQRQNRYDKILKEYPNSVLCTHCGHLLKQK